MRLIDERPGLFITICFVVLYVTVAAEAGMLVAGSLVLMWVVFAGIIAVTGGMLAWMWRMLDDGAPVHEAVRAPEPLPAPVVVPEPVAVAEPAPAGRLVAA